MQSYMRVAAAGAIDRQEELQGGMMLVIGPYNNTALLSQADLRDWDANRVKTDFGHELLGC